MDTPTLCSLEASAGGGYSENQTSVFSAETPPSGIKTLAAGSGVRSSVSGSEICTVKPVRQGTSEDSSASHTVSAFHSGQTTPPKHHTHMDSYSSGTSSVTMVSPTGVACHANVESSKKWSKDEDQTILITVQQRGVSEDVFRDVAHLLSNRSTQEVSVLAVSVTFSLSLQGCEAKRQYHFSLFHNHP